MEFRPLNLPTIIRPIKEVARQFKKTLPAQRTYQADTIDDYIYDYSDTETARESALSRGIILPFELDKQHLPTTLYDSYYECGNYRIHNIRNSCNDTTYDRTFKNISSRTKTNTFQWIVSVRNQPRNGDW